MKNLFTLFTLILLINSTKGQQIAAGTFTGGSSSLTPGLNIASATLLTASDIAADCSNIDGNARSVTTTNMTTVWLEITPNPGYAISAITDLLVSLKISGGTCIGGQGLTGVVSAKIDGIQTAPEQTLTSDCGTFNLMEIPPTPAPSALSSTISSIRLSTNSALIEIIVSNFSCSGSKTLIFDDIQVYGLLSAVLPVDLTKFDVKKNQQSVILSWATASEKNNDHFDIQKSSNGSDFKTIGQVKGNGTTATSAQYNFEDNTPSVGVAYYRLKQVDADAKFVFSQVRSIRFGNHKLVVAPTLAKETISLTVSNDVIVPFEIVDLNGQKVLAGKANGQQTIDVSALHSGMYFIRTEGGETARFVKE